MKPTKIEIHKKSESLPSLIILNKDNNEITLPKKIDNQTFTQKIEELTPPKNIEENDSKHIDDIMSNLITVNKQVMQTIANGYSTNNQTIYKISADTSNGISEIMNYVNKLRYAIRKNNLKLSEHEIKIRNQRDAFAGIQRCLERTKMEHNEVIINYEKDIKKLKELLESSNIRVKSLQNDVADIENIKREKIIRETYIENLKNENEELRAEIHKLQEKVNDQVKTLNENNKQYNLMIIELDKYKKQQKDISKILRDNETLKSKMKDTSLVINKCKQHIYDQKRYIKELINKMNTMENIHYAQRWTFSTDYITKNFKSLNLYNDTMSNIYKSFIKDYDLTKTQNSFSYKLTLDNIVQ